MTKLTYSQKVEQRTGILRFCPQWILDYDKHNYTSSAGQAIRTLLSMLISHDRTGKNGIMVQLSDEDSQLLTKYLTDADNYAKHQNWREAYVAIRLAYRIVVQATFKSFDELEEVKAVKEPTEEVVPENQINLFNHETEKET